MASVSNSKKMSTELGHTLSVEVGPQIGNKATWTTRYRKLDKRRKKSVLAELL